MEAEEALNLVEYLLNKQGKRLNDLQRLVFLGAWQGKDYKEIHRDCASRCELDHLKRNVGYTLWKLLSEILNEKVGKNNLHGPLERSRQQQMYSEPSSRQVGTQVREFPIASYGVERITAAPDTLTQADALASPVVDELDQAWNPIHEDSYIYEDWGTAPMLAAFYGRNLELDHLEQRIRIDGCRLLALYGLPGVGKSQLAIQLARQVRDQFEVLVWRSLEQAPLLPDLIADLIETFPNRATANSDSSTLLHYLSNHRCLIVMDGLETLLRRGVYDGAYQERYEAYGEFLQLVARAGHQSCLILTSWEKPRDIELLEGEPHQVCSLELGGLGEWAGQEIFVAKGRFCGSESDWRELILRYQGNPFALNIAATIVRDLFSGNIADFLDQTRQDTAILDELRVLLQRCFERLSDAERAIVYYLNDHSEPITFAEILKGLGQQISAMELRHILQSLCRRSLIQVTSARYVLQSLITEYVSLLTNRP